MTYFQQIPWLSKDTYGFLHATCQVPCSLHLLTFASKLHSHHVISAGLLPVPPRSSSPVPPSGSRSSTGARQIQLPAMRASGASAALAAGVGLQGNIASTAADAAGGQQSAHTKLTAQQQQHPSPANDNCIYSSTLPAAASVPASAGVSTVPSSVDVGANQMLSASMLSDIQLPSFASTCSVAESLLAQSRQSMDVSSL